MPGFFICNRKFDILLKNEYDHHCKKNTIENNKYTIKRNVLNKFLDDKLFEEDEDIIIITEGVFLNKKDLCERYDGNWFHTVKEMINNNPVYFDEFRGSFSGAHYDKKKNKWFAYTSHVEDKSVFYYNKDGLFIISSSMLYITDALKQLNIPYNLDIDAVYNMLTFAFMVTDRTYVKEIKKLPYGSYIIAGDNEFRVCRYYDLNNESDLLTGWSDDQLIEEWDRLFKKAIQLEYDKDVEYGYEHVTSLSGGLDARMNVWVAHTMGYHRMLNTCFTQSDYLDEKISKQISQKLGTELLVKSLNDGLFMLDYRKIVRMNFGLSVYAGMAHTESMNRYLNFERLGVFHTGEFGGVFHPDPKTSRLEGAYSQKLGYRIQEGDLRPEIVNFEKYKTITRGFKGTLCTQIQRCNYTEHVSPFLYREFFDFFYKIPFEKKKDDYIYKKWILAKYPDAARIPVERFNNGYITDSVLLQKFRKFQHMGIKRSFGWLLWKCHIKKNLDKRITKNHMNPYDKWYNEKKEIRDDLDNYTASTIFNIKMINLLPDSVIEDIKMLYSNGTVLEKTQVITALCAVELFFGERWK